MEAKHRIVSPLVEYFEANNMMRDPLEILGHRVKSVEVKFTTATSPYSLANNKRFYFNPDSTLDGDNSIVTAIEFVGNDVQSYLSDSTTQNVTPDTGTKWMMGIVDRNNELLFYSPLSCFYAPKFTKSGKIFTRKVIMTYFTTQKWMSCFIEAIDSSGITAAQGFKFNVYYTPR